MPNKMIWKPAELVNIDETSFYLVKDNGDEWHDFDLHILSGRQIAMRLRPDYVRGRPQWIARIVRPSAAELPALTIGNENS